MSQAELDGRDILVVIPTLNEAANIRATLSAICADKGLGQATIVVADGGSRDDTLAIVEAMAAADPRIKPLRSTRPTPIQSASINLAVELFSHGKTWLARIDAHSVYPADYVSRLAAKAVETGADSVVTPMETLGQTCFQKAASAAQNSVLGTGGSAHRSGGKGGWVDHGHHALMRLSTYIAVGGYDETFRANEDAELDKRITDAGGRIWLADDLMIGYFPRKATVPLFRQYVNYGAGRASNIARHGGKRKLRQMAPLVVAPAVLLAVAGPVLPLAAAPASLWALACIGFGALLGLKAMRRGEGVCAFASGYCAMVMHFAWSYGYWRQVLLGPRVGPFVSTLSVKV